MDIYKYLNSKDVEKYLRDMNYQFNPIQMAWIVWHCKHITLEEKHKAWEDIINETEDCEIKEEKDRHVVRDSLHEYLKECIEYEKARIQPFYDESNSVFRYELVLKCGTERNIHDGWIINGHDEDDLVCTAKSYDIFSSFNNCLAIAVHCIKENGLENDIRYIKITNTNTETSTEIIRLFDLNGNMLWDDAYEFADAIDKSDDYKDPFYFFDYCCFDDIPVPFEKGDPVINKYSNYNKPCIFIEVNRKFMKDFDIATPQDMYASVYCTMEEYGEGLYIDDVANYLDFEFYDSLKL